MVRILVQTKVRQDTILPQSHKSGIAINLENLNRPKFNPQFIDILVKTGPAHHGNELYTAIHWLEISNDPVDGTVFLCCHSKSVTSH